MCGAAGTRSEMPFSCVFVPLSCACVVVDGFITILSGSDISRIYGSYLPTTNCISLCSDEIVFSPLGQHGAAAAHCSGEKSSKW